MRILYGVVSLFLILVLPLNLVSAASNRKPNCATDFAQLIPATPISVEEAKRSAAAAWQTTERYLRKNGVEQTDENRGQILKIFDRALSHEVTPLGKARKFRNDNGLRVVDAPQLETLRDQGVPGYVVRHLTVDHHSSFGAGLSPNVNSTTQILDLLDPKHRNFLEPAEFDRAFKKIASDNVGDAFGLARAVVRNSKAIRRNPELRERMRVIAVAEDFGIFGPGFDIAASDTVPALLRMNDRMLGTIGPDRTFMDRVNLNFGEKTARVIEKAGKHYDRILFPKNTADRRFAQTLANEFRTSVENGIAQAEKLKVPLHAKSGQTAPVFFADTTSLGNSASSFFQSRLIIPQLVRKLEAQGRTKIERNFNITGDASASTRTVVCANFPDRGTSMMMPAAGQSKSFVESFIAAEKKAIEARLSMFGQMAKRGQTDGDALKLAEERHRQIEQGHWMPQNLPNGNLIFGSTYMNAAEFKSFVEQNLDLLGYN